MMKNCNYGKFRVKFTTLIPDKTWARVPEYSRSTRLEYEVKNLDCSRPSYYRYQEETLAHVFFSYLLQSFSRLCSIGTVVKCISCVRIALKNGATTFKTVTLQIFRGGPSPEIPADGQTCISSSDLTESLRGDTSRLYPRTMYFLGIK
jgi:hypothetical protein